MEKKPPAVGARVDRPVRPLASETRHASFACPEGGQALLTFPTPLTEDTLEMLAELCALMFRGLKRDAVQWDAQQRADDEYLSWFPVMPPRCCHRWPHAGPCVSPGSYAAACVVA